MSSCQYGCVQPPCVKPPSVSSSAPPGAWITPSSVMNSATISSLMFYSFDGWFEDSRRPIAVGADVAKRRRAQRIVGRLIQRFSFTQPEIPHLCPLICFFREEQL